MSSTSTAAAGKPLPPRWAGTTAAERKAAMAKVLAARCARQRAAKIAALIESAPPLTAEQRAKLAALLNANGNTAAAGEDA